MCAVESVLNEPRFKFETQAAITAYQLASVVLQSRDVHQDRIIRFANALEETLKTCFITTHRTNKLKQEKMWGQYHHLRTSEKFLSDWKTFLSEVTEIVPSAAFIQHVTHEVFKQMMQVQFPPTTGASKTLPLLTDIEVNALRYVAGVYKSMIVLCKLCVGAIKFYWRLLVMRRATSPMATPHPRPHHHV